jgi:hypothetical protein
VFLLCSYSRVVSRIAKFIREIRAGTADQGAVMALWQAVRRSPHPVPVDMCEPQEGWQLKIQDPPNNSRYVYLTAEGKPEKQAGER